MPPPVPTESLEGAGHAVDDKLVVLLVGQAELGPLADLGPEPARALTVITDRLTGPAPDGET